MWLVKCSSTFPCWPCSLSGPSFASCSSGCTGSLCSSSSGLQVIVVHSFVRFVGVYVICRAQTSLSFHVFVITFPNKNLKFVTLWHFVSVLRHDWTPTFGILCQSRDVGGWNQRATSLFVSHLSFFFFTVTFNSSKQKKKETSIQKKRGSTNTVRTSYLIAYSIFWGAHCISVLWSQFKKRCKMQVGLTQNWNALVILNTRCVR